MHVCACVYVCAVGGVSVSMGVVTRMYLCLVQRMSVLVRNLASSDSKMMDVFTKGAPEKIAELCRPETGVP